MTIISILIDMSLVSNVCVLAVLFMHICLSIAILDVEMQSQGKGQGSVGRQKRGFRGIVASWMSLLKGARLINHDDRLKLYLKVGSMDDAVFDFYSLDPIDISQTPSGEMYGKVGSNYIYLRGRGPDSSDTFQALLVIIGKDDAKDFGFSISPFRRTRGIKYVSRADVYTELWNKQTI